jgi:hypothetical protein
MQAKKPGLLPGRPPAGTDPVGETGVPASAAALLTGI